MHQLPCGLVPDCPLQLFANAYLSFASKGYLISPAPRWAGGFGWLAHESLRAEVAEFEEEGDD